MKRKITRIFKLWAAVLMLLTLGAIPVKGSDQSAARWRDNAGRSGEAYRTGAEASAETWARNTAGAADTFTQAIQSAGIKERYRRGVQQAGAAKYMRKITEVGADRYAPGVQAAESDYKAGVEPYLQTIAGLTLDQRKPRGDPANYRRVEQVGKALNAKRLAMLGSS